MNLKEVFSPELQAKTASLGEVSEMLEGTVQVVTDIFNEEHRKLIDRIVKVEATVEKLRHTDEVKSLKIEQLERACDAHRKHVSNIKSKVERSKPWKNRLKIMLIFFCLSCDQLPFLSGVPVCPVCLGSNCTPLRDGSGAPVTTQSERGRAVARSMGFDEEELQLGSQP